MKVLLAVDGSKFTEHATHYVLTHLKQLGADLDLSLMHVNVPLPAHVASALGKDSIQHYYQEESQNAMMAARKLLDQNAVKYHEVIGKGEPGEEIARYAEAHKFDLVIIGSKGHGALHNLVLGSTVNKVLAACAVPVLIIR